MSSSVYYKFKSQRDDSRVTFDGTGISVFDLKKEIILQNNLKAVDIDLLLFDHAEQEYKDDLFIIPRSTSVIAKRMPASRPGRGKAALYVANVGSANAAEVSSSMTSRNGAPGHVGGPGGLSQPGVARFQGTMSKRFDGRDLKSSNTPTITLANDSASTHAIFSSNSEDDEAVQIAAMFAETSEQWEETQEKMAQSRAIYNHNPSRSHAASRGAQLGFNRPASDSRPLPPGYICHRCNKKGHWIQDCPTNDDRDYDNRPRVKRTTGIPRSFLKSVDISVEGTPVKGVMVTPEGGFVVAEPDSAAWERQRTRPKGLTEAEVKDRPPKDPALACPICAKVLKDAVKTPCCQVSYCEDCIHTLLLEGSFECPNCKVRIPSLDKLKIDSETRAKVRNYIREAVEESRKEADESVDSSQPAQAKSIPELKEEDFTDTQPGNEAGERDSKAANPHQQGYMNPQELVTQLQAQLAQLMIMQSNPTLPPQQRMTIPPQIQMLTFQLKQAEHFRDMMSMGMGQAQMNGIGMGIGMMGQGVGLSGIAGRNYSNQQQPAQQQFGMQPALNGIHPAYDRLPVNNRRGKRERPEDFGDGGADSKRQYWE